MKKSIKLISVSMLFLLSFFPCVSHARLCYYPEDNGAQLAFSQFCSESDTPASICENIGFTLNYVALNYVYCMDKNCVTGGKGSSSEDRVKCLSCAQGFYISGYSCKLCPSGATCDGYTIQCGEGYFSNRSSCQQCNSSCKTCSGAGTDNCTSCNSEYYLSGNTCLACPSNAACNGSSFTCNTGYSKTDGACVADQQEPAQTNTVNSCPSRMTLSADGCCCINK